MQAAWRGFLFGLGQFGVGVSWLYIALNEFGRMPGPLAALALFLFFVYLALYPALLGYLHARWFSALSPLSAAVSLAALWVLAEWLRGWLMTGFPWLHLGYSQIDTPLANLAPWLGVYAVSFVTVLSAALLAGLIFAERRARWILGSVLLGLWLGAWALGRIEWVSPSGAALRVAGIQGNVALDQKWYPAFRQEIMRRYTELTVAQRDVDLVVWPEGAVPAYRDEVETAFLEPLARAARQRDFDLLLGILEEQAGGDGRLYFNTALGLGSRTVEYRKHHLVPFGEFLPLKDLLQWLLQYLHIPMSNFSPGPAGQGPLELAGHRLGVSICYEFGFGEEIIRVLPEADVLVNISEDAWYGDSLAPHQHQQMARMRSLEAGRPMVRVTNTGVSALIDHRGRVITRAPQFKIFVMRGSVQPMQGMTPYARFGNLPIIGGSGVLVLLAAGLAWRRSRRPV